MVYAQRSSAAAEPCCPKPEGSLCDRWQPSVSAEEYSASLLLVLDLLTCWVVGWLERERGGKVGSLY